VILVGEIRDLETAQIAVQASLTGHLVLSRRCTPTTRRARSPTARPGHGAVPADGDDRGVVAQRLVRKICANCKEEFTPTEAQLYQLGLTPEDLHGRPLFFGRGCDYCNNTGYKGRTALFEMMVFDDELRDMIMQSASTSILRDHARKRGMRSLRDAGLELIFDGITSIDEVVRETLSEDI
jgi:type IV pilus assembly protein PilB